MEVERCLKGIPPLGATDVVRDQLQLLLSVENKYGTRKDFYSSPAVQGHILFGKVNFSFSVRR